MVVKSSLTNSIPAKKWEGHVKLRIQLSNRAFCSENVSQIFCRNRKFVPCHLEWSQGKFSLVSALIRLRDVAVLFRPCQRTCCLRRRGMMEFFPRSNCCYPLCDRRHRRDVEFFRRDETYFGGKCCQNQTTLFENCFVTQRVIYLEISHSLSLALILLSTQCSEFSSVWDLW